jgi:hypothetical protein
MNAIDYDRMLTMLLERNGQAVTVIVGAPGDEPRMIARYPGVVTAAEGLGRRTEEGAFIIALGNTDDDPPLVFLHRKDFKWAQDLGDCLHVKTEAADIQFWRREN